MKENKTMSGTTILPCSCRHDGQDRIHGGGQRVHNLLGAKTGKDSRQARCTVCERVRDVPASAMP